MTTLYRPVDALTKTQAATPGILHSNSPKPMWLVPIEAEEETAVDPADLNLDPEHEYWTDDPDLLAAVRDAPKRTRLVTPWEEA